jgi:RNA-directed DNA polymerase
MKNGQRKSDNFVVPERPPNKGAEASAEAEEGRELAKGNPPEGNELRTPSRAGTSSAIAWIREVAARNPHRKFTALLHHIYAPACLERSYAAIRHDTAAGVDGVTWRAYGEQLEEHLRELSDRVKRNAYRAQPVRRVYLPKAGGGRRPIGVPALEDKIVQRAAAEVVGAIYEPEFYGFSYGFRPGRSPHHALDALTVGIETRKVNWVLEADIEGFFDNVNHEHLRGFIEERVADRRVIHLIMKWLHAGVMEEGRHRRQEVGTVQGGSISPLLANIYLHHVFDRWAHTWRKKEARGEVLMVRFADDFVVGFQHEDDARRFRTALEERFTAYGLALHPKKTRIIEFGRYATERREKRGKGKPETFDFLGFTHSSGKTRKGAFAVHRRTMRTRMQRKLREVKEELRRRRKDPLPTQGAYVRAVVQGHVQYYGVPRNSRQISAFRHAVGWLWRRSLCRCSQKGRISWKRMRRLLARWLPPARICHPYPRIRLVVTT